MKSLVTSVLLALFGLSAAWAQNSYEVIEQPLPYNRTATSFTTNIIGLNEDFVLYHWEKFIENHGGKTYVSSVEKGNIEMHSEHVKFPLLDDEEVSIHTRVTPNRTESGVLLTLWIQMKDGDYFSSKSHPKQASAIKDWLLKFNQNLETLEEKIIHN